MLSLWHIYLVRGVTIIVIILCICYNLNKDILPAHTNLEHFTCQICRESLLVHSLPPSFILLTLKLMNRDEGFKTIKVL